MNKIHYLLLFCILLISCTQTRLAPFTDLKWENNRLISNAYKVQKGDTLYAIAFRYDKDYKKLARYNHIAIHSHLKEGQIVRLYSGKTSYIKTSTLSKSTTVYPVYPLKKPAKMVAISSVRWSWPLKGQIKNIFMPDIGKKGIDIAGKKGDSIYAARSGIIAYAGNGLSGYGNLIIIKHDKDYLSAYAHNARNVVHEGQYVKVHQKIADIGTIEKKYWGLHFEVRKQGKPVNPLKYLGKMYS